MDALGFQRFDVSADLLAEHCRDVVGLDLCRRLAHCARARLRPCLARMRSQVRFAVKEGGPLWSRVRTGRPLEKSGTYAQIRASSPPFLVYGSRELATQVGGWWMGQPATGCGFLTLSARPRAPSARPRGASSGVMPRNDDASRGLGHRVRRAVPSIPAAQHGGGRGGGWRGPVLWMPPPRQLCQGRYHGARVRGPPLGGAGGAARAGYGVRRTVRGDRRSRRQATHAVAHHTRACGRTQH